MDYILINTAGRSKDSEEFLNITIYSGGTFTFFQIYELVTHAVPHAL